MSEEKNKELQEEVKEEIKENPAPQDEEVSDEELDASSGGSVLSGVSDKNRMDD